MVNAIGVPDSRSNLTGFETIAFNLIWIGAADSLLVIEGKMAEIESDDPRLRATEKQMRRALGLREGSSPSGQVSGNVPHPQRRQFVRDGDVPVEVLHGSDFSSRVNQLAATRDALQAQTTAREEAEQMLAEARHTIHDLQTKLGHERLARDEAVEHVASAKRKVEQELATARVDLEAERLLRLATAKERDQAILGRQAAEDRLRQAKEVRKIARRPETAAPAQPPLAAPEPRRRGRPPKVNRDDTGVVEWWTPGWKDRYR
jgi:hypothetical protein